jgi:hypothetical protein
MYDQISIDVCFFITLCRPVDTTRQLMRCVPICILLVCWCALVMLVMLVMLLMLV